MGLFSRKKVAEVVEAAAPVVGQAASAVKDAAAPAAEKVAAAVANAAAVVEEKAAAVGEKAAAAAAEEAAPAATEAAATEEKPELTEKEKGLVYKVTMNYHAGHDQYNEWPNGGKTIHAGIGWFHPFGPSRYYGIQDCGEGYNEEAKAFPAENFFTEDWMKNYETDLFCIYRLDDGDIYAWDGMFAVRGLDENKTVVYNSEFTRQDVLVNVVVGGTGRYEGARGLLIGTAEGGGETKGVAEMPDGNPLELPATIIKHLEGYIRIPEKD